MLGSLFGRGPCGRWGAVLALVACLAGPAPTAAQDFRSQTREALDVTFDLLVLRPVGAANAVVGWGLFVPAALLASPGGRDPIVEAWERFVLTPTEFAYTRPLGEF